MILPPVSHDVKVISIGMFVPGNQPVVWRGPMLHRALQQFLADVFWGDLDVLLLDLPPGTGDIAISVAQLVPNAEILVVTTPQQAAAEVAERAGRDRPADPPAHRRRRREHVLARAARRHPPGDLRLRRRPRGGRLADRSIGSDVPLLGQVPLDTALREGGDSGTPVVLGHPDSAAAVALRGIARGLATARAGSRGARWGSRPPGADSGRLGVPRDGLARVEDLGGRGRRHDGRDRLVVVLGVEGSNGSSSASRTIRRGS